jgi:hypothetical protein
MGYSMNRYCFLLRVKPELLDEYRAAPAGMAGDARRANRASRVRLAQGRPMVTEY